MAIPDSIISRFTLYPEVRLGRTFFFHKIRLKMIPRAIIKIFRHIPSTYFAFHKKVFLDHNKKNIRHEKIAFLFLDECPPKFVFRKSMLDHFQMNSRVKINIFSHTRLIISRFTLYPEVRLGWKIVFFIKLFFNIL